MKMFILKVFGSAVLMQSVVLIGIHAADTGIHKIKGPNHPAGQKTVSIWNQQAGLTSSGMSVSGSDIKAKQKKLEEIHSFNLFSTLGKKMSEGFSKTSEKLVEWVAE